MALLNRFSKLNDRGETGIFTFIVTKSVTRDFHRDATTKDFCFGYHRWAISFQRPTEKVLGVHLLLRNPSPNTACVVDFTLTLLNRQHFSQNEVHTRRQAKFTITNPMQGVSRWIQMSELIDRHFSNETGEFLFELSLSNMTTIFECDIQLSSAILTQYKGMLKNGINLQQQINEQQQQQQSKSRQTGQRHSQQRSASGSNELINLETNYFTFGAFDWSLTIVPLVAPSNLPSQPQTSLDNKMANSSTTSSSSSTNNLLTPNKNHSNSNLSISSNNHNHSSSINANHNKQQQLAGQAKLEPVCRVYLNRLSGFESLCRVKYRVILGHHQPGGNHPPEFVDSRQLDQISDTAGRIRGYQFRNTNILKLISLRSNPASSSANVIAGSTFGGSARHHQHGNSTNANQHHHQTTTTTTTATGSLDLRVHIEMFCANTVSEARVPLQRRPNEAQVSNCSDRNKQAWCVESDSESGEHVRLKLFFMDLQSVPRNHIRYISWIAYVVRRDSKSGAMRDSLLVRNSPHSNYYLQDGIDMGTIMDTDIPVQELNNSPKSYLEAEQLIVHIEWVDSLLLFSHLYNNYDSLATIQRHQIRRELSALQLEFELLERKYVQSRRDLRRLLANSPASTQLAQPGEDYSVDTEEQDDEQEEAEAEEEEEDGEDNEQLNANHRLRDHNDGSPEECDDDNSDHFNVHRKHLSNKDDTSPSPPKSHLATRAGSLQHTRSAGEQQSEQQQLFQLPGSPSRRPASSATMRTSSLRANSDQWTPPTGGQLLLQQQQQQQQQQQPVFQDKLSSQQINLHNKRNSQLSGMLISGQGVAATPMSYDERLKFSSSTPPMVSQSASVFSGALEGPPPHRSNPNRRRQLPQPGKSLVERAGPSSLDRRDSLSAANFVQFIGLSSNARTGNGRASIGSIGDLRISEPPIGSGMQDYPRGQQFQPAAPQQLRHQPYQHQLMLMKEQRLLLGQAESCDQVRSGSPMTRFRQFQQEHLDGVASLTAPLQSHRPIYPLHQRELTLQLVDEQHLRAVRRQPLDVDYSTIGLPGDQAGGLSRAATLLAAGPDADLEPLGAEDKQLAARLSHLPAAPNAGQLSQLNLNLDSLYLAHRAANLAAGNQPGVDELNIYVQLVKSISMVSPH